MKVSYGRMPRVLLVAGLLAFVGFLFFPYFAPLYLSAGLLAASGTWKLVDWWRDGFFMQRRIKRRSVITCPRCGHREEEEMPEEACLFFYECKACRHMLRPGKGDCCVFCTHGSVPCPDVQAKTIRARYKVR